MFFRQSIIWKMFIHFLILGGIVFGIVYYLSESGFPLTLEVLGIALFVFLLLYLLSILWLILRPMRSIMKEMKALLTGRKFRKIYTKRVDEIGVIALFFNKVTDSLSKISGTIKEEKRMSDELSIAAKLQQNILPDKAPCIPGLEVVAKNRSAVEVGGDNFDFVDYDGGKKTLIYLGDVTGHGVPAAIVMTMVHTLVSIFAELKNNIYDIVVNVNKQLKSRIQSTMFMTMVMLSWDHETQKMTYIGAGHEHILVYRTSTGECESLVSGGIALGMVPDNSKLVQEKELSLNEGDVVVLYTDGIVEAKNGKDEMYGLDRLIESIKKYSPEYSPDGISYHVAVDFSRFVGDSVQADDISLIVTRYVGKGKEKVSENMEWGKS
jgi:hypothetical protein